MSKVKISDFEYFENIQEYDELVKSGVLYGDVDNSAIYDFETEDLEETIKAFGLRKPIYVSEKYRNSDTKKIYGGHRRNKSLEVLKVTHRPIKYVNVTEYDNSYDNTINLMADNQTRDISAFKKYKSVVKLNELYEEKNGVKPSTDIIKSHCSLSTTNYTTYKHAEDIRMTNPVLWKKVESQKVTLSSAWDTHKNGEVAKNRNMSPNTMKVVTSDRVNRALRLTQMAMSQYYEVGVPDPLNPNETWYMTREFQKQTITADVHEAFTKSLARILVADGLNDAVALNKGLADLQVMNNEVQLETKATMKKPRSTKTEWTGSRKVKGAYYNLLKFNSDFTMWFHAIVKVPFDKWMSGGKAGIKKLTDVSVNELIKNNDGKILHGYIDNDGDVTLMSLV